MTTVSAVVVMGVSGSGKTSVGRALAEKVGGTFLDADDLHPASNVAKMASGTPLTDADRWPWLDVVAQELRAGENGGSPVVIACSALRRAYRDRLRRDVGEVVFIHLDGSKETISGRMDRPGHFMPASLLDSQLQALEPLEEDEVGERLDIRLEVAELVGVAVRLLSAAPIPPR